MPEMRARMDTEGEWGAGTMSGEGMPDEVLEEGSKGGRGAGTGLGCKGRGPREAGASEGRGDSGESKCGKC